jgi:hypothetical protein
LQLDDPAMRPPPEYASDEGEPQTSHSPARAPKTMRSDGGNSSIYDYLDEIETQSELQMQTFVPGSVGSRSISSEREQDNRKQNAEADWGDAKSHSPAPSYRSASARSSTDNSNQYVVGIKEKLATLTIELNVRPLGLLCVDTAG